MSGSAVITCGGAPTTAQYASTGSYFQGGGFTDTQATLNGRLSSHVSIVGSNPLGTDDTTSYATADVAAYQAASVHDSFVRIAGVTQSTVTIPGDATEVDVNVVIVARSTYSAGAEHFLLSLTALDPTTGGIVITEIGSQEIDGVTSTFQRFTTPVGDTDPANWTAPLGALGEFMLRVTWENPATVDVAYLGLEVSWLTPGPVAPPPLRNGPFRPGDMYASTWRNVPPPQTYQAGNRNVGGIL